MTKHIESANAHVVDGVLAIPDGVTEIGEWEFYCSDMKSLVLPEGLLSIGSHAFADSAGLEAVTFPESLREIGEGAFRGCDKLKEIHMSPAVYERVFTNWEERVLSGPMDVGNWVGGWRFDGIGIKAERGAVEIAVCDVGESYRHFDVKHINEDGNRIEAITEVTTALTFSIENNTASVVTVCGLDFCLVSVDNLKSPGWSVQGAKEYSASFQSKASDICFVFDSSEDVESRKLVAPDKVILPIGLLNPESTAVPLCGCVQLNCIESISLHAMVDTGKRVVLDKVRATAQNLRDDFEGSQCSFLVRARYCDSKGHEHKTFWKKYSAKIENDKCCTFFEAT